MSMRRVSQLYSRTRWRTPTFYVDSRDAVNDGSGNVASVTARVGGQVFAADVSGNRPTIDTALLGGTHLILFGTGNLARNLQHSAANSFGGDDNPVSFVFRVRPSTNAGRAALCTHVANTPPATADGFSSCKINSVNVQFERDQAGGSTGTYNSSATTINTSTWYTIGYSFTGSNVRMFRNGVFLSQSASSLTSLGSHTVITLGNNSALGQCQYGYYAGWKGWAGVAISDAQHLYEHNQFAAWAA